VVYVFHYQTVNSLCCPVIALLTFFFELIVLTASDSMSTINSSEM